MRIKLYGNYPRRQLYREFRAFTRRERRELLQIFTGMAACIAVILFFDRGLLGGFLTGALTTFFALLVVWNFLLYEDGLRFLHGAWAEDWTRDELQAAVKAGDAWHAVDNVRLPGGDVDHVLIAPGGVVAVETKYVGNAARLRYQEQLIADASRAGVRVRGLLSTVKAARYPVKPMLVVWGPGCTALPDVSSADDVAIVKGKALKIALTAYSKGPLAEDHAEALLESLLTYRRGLTARLK